MNATLTLDSLSILGRGRTADVFGWSDGRALKLYHAGWPVAAAEHEYQLAQAVHAAGAAAPAIYGFTQLDGRHGVIYERIEGQSLLNQTTARPWTLLHSARLMAELHAQMHACRPSGLPAQRDQLQPKIGAAHPLTASLKRAALDALDQLPDDTVLCHGDYHPDNILLSARGSVILDWTAAACGHPLADVARTTLIMRHAAVPSHVPGRRLIEAGRRLWHQVYLHRYCQLRSVTSQQVDAWLLPVAAARLAEGIPEEVERLSKLVSQLANSQSRTYLGQAPHRRPRGPACRSNYGNEHDQLPVPGDRD